MILCSAPGEEAVLTHVEIEALQATVPGKSKRFVRVSVYISMILSLSAIIFSLSNVEVTLPESYDGIVLANVALGLMFRCFGRGQSVQHWQPDHALWLLLQPAQEMHGFYFVFILSRFFEATANAGLDVRTTECRDLTQLSRHLYTVVQQKTKFPLIHQPVGIRDQTEQICNK